MFLGNNGFRDDEGNELPRLVYVSREKRPGFDHHKKAGAMNALVSRIFPCFIFLWLIDDSYFLFLSLCFCNPFLLLYFLRGVTDVS